MQLGVRDGNEIYTYKQINATGGLLTINSFSIGNNEDSDEHKAYKGWIDSVFVKIRENGVEHLIVDVRNNGGGTNPNDVITYTYLTSRDFQESRQAWISFNKVPLLKYYDSPFPRLIRPLGVGWYNRNFRKRFPNEVDGRYFISEHANEMKVRQLIQMPLRVMSI